MLDQPPRSSEFIRNPHLQIFGQFCKNLLNCMLVLQNQKDVEINLICDKLKTTCAFIKTMDNLPLLFALASKKWLNKN